MDQKARDQGVSAHARQIGEFEDDSIPLHNARGEEIETEAERAATRGGEHNTRQADPTYNGSGAQAPIAGTIQGEVGHGATGTRQTLPTGPTHLRFGTPSPPTVPLRARGGTVSDNIYPAKHQNRYASLRQHGNESIERVSKKLTTRILRGGSSSAASSFKGSRGR
jgi:hypothetical protein